MFRPRIFLRKARPLPDAIYVELVGLLITGRLPVLVMAITVACVTGVAFMQRPDMLTLALAVPVVLMLAVRFAAITRFTRETQGRALNSDRAALWERRYGAILWSYALLLGMFNCRVAQIGDSATHIVLVGEIFGFCAGQVTRKSVRPQLCAVALLLAAVPTAVGLLFPAWEAASFRESMTYLAMAILILLFTFSSLETVNYLYRTILAQLTAKRHLASLARLDPLTGLPNRLMLRERLEADLAAIGAAGRKVALHLIDLDGFKAVNDGHGHPAGDTLLKMVAGRLTETLRSGDTAARLGGDEFAVVQAGIDSHDEADMLGRRIVRVLNGEYTLDGAAVRIGASVGVAVAPEQADGFDLLVERADGALYEAKRSGRGTIRFWTGSSRHARAA